MTTNHTPTRRRCNAAPSGPGAPVSWRCAKAPGHKSELHQTATGGGWGPKTAFAVGADMPVMTTAEVAAAFGLDVRTISKQIKKGRFGEETFFLTPGGQHRFYAEKISAMVAEGAGAVLTVAQLSAALRVDPKTIGTWDRQGRFGDGAVFRTAGGHRRFYADKIKGLVAAGGLS